jgi:hypothetical protein
MSAEATAASLRDAPRRVPGQAEIQEAFRRILTSLPEGEAQRLANSLSEPTALDSGDACWTTRMIYKSLAKLSAEDQALIARVLAVQ